ncbi:MAG: hypothetical protein ABH859_01800 [Pseudomonadota bacterium]
MKVLGYLLFGIGVIFASLVAVIDKELVNWVYFIPLMIVGIIGVILIRVETHRTAKCEHKIDADIRQIEKSLVSIVNKIKEFNQKKDKIGVYEVHKKIDEIFVDDLDNFVEARESISHCYGVQNYADLMSHFAAGERYLNRCWTASADGYIDEVKAYIARATEQFVITLEQFRQLAKNS